MSYNGWMIPEDERARLLARYTPSFPINKATHVTLMVDSGAEFPIDANIELVGWVYDETGLEAYVASVNGTTVRPDGLVFHLTYSLVEGRASKESNDVIARLPMTPLLMPEPIRTRGFFCPGDGAYVTTPLTAR